MEAATRVLTEQMTKLAARQHEMKHSHEKSIGALSRQIAQLHDQQEASAANVRAILLQLTERHTGGMQRASVGENAGQRAPLQQLEA